MEAGTAASHSTGSKTIADLMVCAAAQFADRVGRQAAGIQGDPAADPSGRPLGVHWTLAAAGRPAALSRASARAAFSAVSPSSVRR